MQGQRLRLRLLKWKLVVIIVAVALVAVSGTYFAVVYFSSPCPSGSPLRSLVIIANDTTGFNDSRYQPFQMNVQLGDCVVLMFVNNSQAQAHSLGISYYLPNGILARGGETKSAEFSATKTGQFQAFETIPSTINAWTDKCGILNVT